ncbi:type III secretion system needle filament subunit SctF [Sodalis sp. (in: enterobacteria)]|uniref:type III secretion system needle filament subunit SctF n=1 Tax=Sodalis sp. (in: enterobacteria) TaxID=1898979 RepID=UPI003F380F90
MPALTTDDWFIDNISNSFNEGAMTMWAQLETAQDKLKDTPDDPSVLAEYQAKLAEYTLFRNAQSSTVKGFKDIGATIVQNFR